MGNPQQTFLAGMLCLASHAASAAEYYFCDASQTYYPAAKTCTGQWRKIDGPPATYQAPAAAPPQASASMPEPPPVPASSLPSAAFQQGLADRAEVETWGTGLQGDQHDGAIYWAGQRRKPHPGSCADPSKSQDWQTGCFEAQRRLAVSDARRRSEPDYMQGWNSWTVSTLQSVPPPSSATPIVSPSPAAQHATSPSVSAPATVGTDTAVKSDNLRQFESDLAPAYVKFGKANGTLRCEGDMSGQLGFDPSLGEELIQREKLVVSITSSEEGEARKWLGHVFTQASLGLSCRDLRNNQLDQLMH